MQMSLSYWPQRLAQQLHEQFGYEDDIVDASHREVHELLEKRLEKVLLMDLLERAEET